MTLYTQALKTYEAIYGESPQYNPYKGASDAPFNGMSVEILSELCDERKVKAQLREWKKQYPLKTQPTESLNRFIKVSNKPRSNKNFWDNAIWVPKVYHNFSEENGFTTYEVESNVSDISVIAIHHRHKPLNHIISKNKQCYNVRYVNPLNIKSRIPNPGERDLFELLTNVDWLPSIIDAAVKSNWKNNNDRYHSIFRKDLPEPEFFIQKSFKKAVYPQAVVHTSHGYPMILCTSITGARLDITYDGTTNYYLHSFYESDDNPYLRWQVHFYFPGEIVKISDSHKNTISNRLSCLQRGEVNEPV